MLPLCLALAPLFPALVLLEGMAPLLPSAHARGLCTWWLLVSFATPLMPSFIHSQMLRVRTCVRAFVRACHPPAWQMLLSMGCDS